MAVARKRTPHRGRRSGDDLAPMLAALTGWFQRHARDLPWRRERSGYAALVSEAMLQQTQVSRVIDRYVAFMDRFPTVHELAAADEEEVLTHWQGLGYYRRARHLHAAARMIAERHHGKVPTTREQLLDLPGIGLYTAGAIASIAFNQRVPLVDGNVERVLARWHGRRRNGDDEGLRTWAWTQAKEVIEVADHPGPVNEALMELGALVCTPRRPKCDGCPVARWCTANKQQSQHEVPGPKRRTKQQVVHHHAVIIRRGGLILLEQRDEDGLWSRMWQTPTIESSRALRPTELMRKLAVNVRHLKRHGTFEHQTTHRRITFHVFTAVSRVRSGTWRLPDDVSDLPLSSPQQRIVEMAMQSDAE